MKGVPSVEISDFERGAPFINAPISPKAVDCHGSVKPLKRSFGHFSRPLLEEQFLPPYNYIGGGLYD